LPAVLGRPLQVSELLEDLRERLRPLKTRLFPQQVLLQLSDEAVVGQPLLNGQPGPIFIDVPLPALTIKRGLPIEIEPLADLIGDLLVRDGLINAYVLASLPQVAVEWRVIDWAGRSVPEDGLAELRRLNPELGLAYPLEEASLDLRPLAGAPGKQLLACTRREVVEGWIQVFHQAGTNLDRLACPQTCRLAALQGPLEGIPAGTLVLLVTASPQGGQLMAIRDGVPLFEWPLPAEEGAKVAEVQRCLAFLRREFADARRVRLLLDGELAEQEALEAALDLQGQRVDCAPFGSLVMQGLAIPEITP
jgi:Tfp pilus assembly PilM family ATPase